MAGSGARLHTIVVLCLAAGGAASPLAQQQQENEEALANLMLDLDGVQCPLSHPYAFKWGDRCCMFPREKEPPNDLPKFWDSVSEFCTGLSIRLSSHCCQDDAYISCPKSPCTSSSLVTTTTPLSLDPDDFEIISVKPPIKSAVAFIPVTSKTTTTTLRTTSKPTTTTRRTTTTTVFEGEDFEIISIQPPKNHRVTQIVLSDGGASRIIFPDD